MFCDFWLVDFDPFWVFLCFEVRCFSLYRDYSYLLTLLNLNSKGRYSSPESEIKFRRCLFTFSIKHEIRHFRVVVVQKRQGNVRKSVMHMQSCCFAYWTYCFLDVLVAVASLNLKVPNIVMIDGSEKRNCEEAAFELQSSCVLKSAVT